MWEFLGSAYRDMGLYEKAIEMCNKALQDAPDWTNVFICLAVCYANIGRHEEASYAVKEVLRTDPDFSLDFYEKIYPFANQSKRRSQIKVLRNLGLK
jgi:tetratricopeptide (TPR) repeat protein